MSKESNPQYARIEQPLGDDYPTVYCPICGKATAQAGEDSPDPDHSPCKHLAFIFVGAIGTFEYKSDDFENRIKDIDDIDLSFDTFASYLQDAGYGNNLLAIELTHGGIACGPVWYTDLFGFDYNPLTEKTNSTIE